MPERVWQKMMETLFTPVLECSACYTTHSPCRRVSREFVGGFQLPVNRMSKGPGPPMEVNVPWTSRSLSRSLRLQATKRVKMSQVLSLKQLNPDVRHAGGIQRLGRWRTAEGIPPCPGSARAPTQVFSPASGRTEISYRWLLSTAPNILLAGLGEHKTTLKRPSW